MFAALARVVTRRPWQIRGAWVVLAVLIIATAPALTSTTDEAVTTHGRDLVPVMERQATAIGAECERLFPTRRDRPGLLQP